MLKLFRGRFRGDSWCFLASGSGERKVVAWVSECIQKKMGCEEENLVLIPSLSIDFNGVCGQRNGFLPPMAEHGRGDGVGLRPQGMGVMEGSPWWCQARFEKEEGGLACRFAVRGGEEEKKKKRRKEEEWPGPTAQ